MCRSQAVSKRLRRDPTVSALQSRTPRRGKEVDVDKKITLPKGQFIDDTDAEGQGLFPTDDDVEGHGKPSPDDFTVLPPPPGIGPGHGGELHDSGDDR
jgi:hypothetical protein